MNIVSNLTEWQQIRKTLTNKTIGLIPTMGHLHAGHLSLCQRSVAENDMTMVNIFVNPTQFNQAEDFKHYPRTIEDDLALLQPHQIDYVLLPQADEIYADGYEVCVTENKLSQELEGEHRPGHFNGVLTVVLKLFNLIQPTRAYFGEKDYQQLLLIKKMVSALFVPTEIVACKTMRAEDGLALSSRNSRLTPAQRELASHFPRLLSSHLSNDEVKVELIKLGFRVDYITHQWNRRLGAVWLDQVRLIDNMDISIQGNCSAGQ